MSLSFAESSLLRTSSVRLPSHQIFKTLGQQKNPNQLAQSELQNHISIIQIINHVQSLDTDIGPTQNTEAAKDILTAHTIGSHRVALNVIIVDIHTTQTAIVLLAESSATKWAIQQSNSSIWHGGVYHQPLDFENNANWTKSQLPYQIESSTQGY